MKIINLVEDAKGKEGCGYEHGLSFYIETKKHKILMDAGATDLFLKNAQLLSVDLSRVDTVVLSHGHYDHGGGLPAFAGINSHAPIYLRADAGEAYFHQTGSLEKYIGLPAQIGELSQCVYVKEDALSIDEELSLFSGITGRKYWAEGNRQLKKKKGQELVQDEFTHEQCLVISEEGKRVLLSGCAHNGILNILDRYKELYQGLPDAVISGFHMMKKGEYSQEEREAIQKTALALREYDTLFYSGHCTGERAFAMMKEIMGEKLLSVHSGESLSLF